MRIDLLAFVFFSKNRERRRGERETHREWGGGGGERETERDRGGPGLGKF